MKRIVLSALFLSFFITAFATTWTVVNDGFSFSPATLTITEGDTVIFDLQTEHNSVEVSETTWNSNGTTPLSGGWVLPFGGGMVLPADLTEGMHWYVCQPHASGGMKGIIIVQGTTSTDESQPTASFTVSPNPSSGLISFSTNTSDRNSLVEIFDMNGVRVYTGEHQPDKPLRTIDLSNEAKGLYLIRYYSDKGVLTRKLLLQ